MNPEKETITLISSDSNSVDIKIHQKQIAKYFYEKHPFFNLENLKLAIQATFRGKIVIPTRPFRFSY